MVLSAAVDRLSRDTTDLLVIARDVEKAGAGLRSIAEPLMDTSRGEAVAIQRFRHVEDRKWDRLLKLPDSCPSGKSPSHRGWIATLRSR
jgi:hypothetical protein